MRWSGQGMAEDVNEARRGLWARGTPRFALAKATSNTVQYQFANKMLSFATNGF